MTCIYCLKDHEGPFSKAHIFPQSIFGDHEYLFLNNGEVCSSCNNRLSRLEKKAKRNLGLFPMFLGPGVNKKGKPTTIDAPGLRGTRDPKNPRIILNLGKTPYRASDGQMVRPAKTPERIEYLDKGQDAAGHHGTITHIFRMVLIARMLAKIGFETLCLEQGAAYCADSRWDRLRAFILRGKGQCTCAVPREWKIQTAPDGSLQLPKGITLVVLEDPEDAAGSKHDWVAFVGIGAPFVVDLSPDNAALKKFVEKKPEALDTASLMTFGAP